MISEALSKASEALDYMNKLSAVSYVALPVSLVVSTSIIQPINHCIVTKLHRHDKEL